MSEEQIERILKNTKFTMEMEGFTIDDNLEDVGRRILKGELDRKYFIESVKQRYRGDPSEAEVNTLHPFREGNGRTQRVFFEELARRARYEINFSNVTPDELLKADIAAYYKDYAPMIDLLEQRIVKR